MKFITKITTVLIIICLIASTFIFSAAAATLYFSKNTVSVGEDVTVSVSINPGNEKMYAISFYLQYDETVLKYNGGNGVGDAGVLKVVESPSGTTSERYDFKFTAIKAGTSTIAVTDCVYEVLGQNGATPKNYEGASAKLTVKDSSLSKNAKLSSLKVSGYSLSPSFSPSKTNYKLKVPFDVTKISVNAKTEDSNAKVKSVEGNSDLKVGDNKVIVSVEAADGSLKEYIITVTRAKEEDTSSNENTLEDNNFDDGITTTVAGSEYTVLTKLSEDMIFEGFSIETTTVNGIDVETAVDTAGSFRVFYLKALGSDETVPYLYDSELDSFEKLKYTVYNNQTYIFADALNDFDWPEGMFSSKITFGDFTVDTMTASNDSNSEFHYVYCHNGKEFGVYRYDVVEQTLQRFPDFENTSFNKFDENTSLITRFNSLSTNGKVIIIALSVVVLSVFALVILMIVYFFKKILSKPDQVRFVDLEEDFDSVEVKK